MKNKSIVILLKFKLLLLAALFLSTCLFMLSSCSTHDTYSKKHWTGTVNGSPVGGNSGNNFIMCCQTVYCNNADNHNCQAHANTAGAACGDLDFCVVLQRMDTLTNYYRGDSMAAFYAKYNLNLLIPDLATYRSDAQDSLVAGVWKLHVSSEDSSIIILKAPFDTVKSTNVVFAAEGINRRNMYNPALDPRN